MESGIVHRGRTAGLLALVASMIACGGARNPSTAGSTSTPLQTDAEENFRLRAVIAVPNRPLTAFDISWVDQTTQKYYLADRSNAGVDIFDALLNTFVHRVPGFVGVDIRGNDFSGPNGVLTITSRHELWAGDGPGAAMNSSVKVIDLSMNPPQIVQTIFTNGQRRSDEMSFDPEEEIVAVVNNADNPPFMTLISSRPPRHVLGRITFDENLGRPFGVMAFTDGLEQSVWNPDTHLIYLSVPELDGVFENGAIGVIDPRSRTLIDLFRVHNCHPAGLALGPNQKLLIGCSDPSRTVVMNARNGMVHTEILEVGGSDEVWFNPGDDRYYLAARTNPSGPVLGIINARNNHFVTKITTAFNAHSVAANSNDNHVFVPLTPQRAGHPEDPNTCVDFGGHGFDGRGCIGVYWASDD